MLHHCLHNPHDSFRVGIVISVSLNRIFQQDRTEHRGEFCCRQLCDGRILDEKQQWASNEAADLMNNHSFLSRLDDFNDLESYSDSTIDKNKNYELGWHENHKEW